MIDALLLLGALVGVWVFDVWLVGRYAQHALGLTGPSAGAAGGGGEAVSAPTPPAAPASPQPDAGVTACTCAFYVVDYSGPDRYHPENLDREDDPNCPAHGVQHFGEFVDSNGMCGWCFRPRVECDHRSAEFVIST